MKRLVLIVFGGFAGTGKTTLSRRLSTELGIPRLGSDTIGRTIARLEILMGSNVDAYWIAYDVLIRPMHGVPPEDGD